MRKFFAAEAEALRHAYKNLELLLPHGHRKGAAHPGEEGRHIESLIRSFLNKHLPRNYRAFSGFILRAATQTQHGRYERVVDGDQHSTQLDVIVYDVANYPIYEQFEEFVIVPPEGVYAIVSVKKRLYSRDIAPEIQKLAEAVQLCQHNNCALRNDIAAVRGPNIALIAFTCEDSFDHALSSFDNVIRSVQPQPFDKLLGQLIVLDSGTAFLSKPVPWDENVSHADYVVFKHHKSETHLGVQFLLTGIMSSIYDPTRTTLPRPGFTSFEPGRGADKQLDPVPVSGLRCRPLEQNK